MLRDENGRFAKGHENVAGFIKGSKHTQEAKDKVSESLRGRYGKNSRRWKGDKAGYVAKHMWILKHYGKANGCYNWHCEFTVNNKPKRYEWHNLSGEHKRDIRDYISLCCSCHRRYHKGSIKIRRNSYGTDL